MVAPHWAVKDPASGELRGVAVDIARALAQRLGVALEMVEYPSPPSVLDGLKTGAWDIAFLAVDPSRAVVVDFAPPYLQIDPTFLVQGSSSLRNVGDVDQPGVRVAIQYSARLPASRVLAVGFHTTQGAIAVPKGQAGLLAYVREFTEQARPPASFSARSNTWACAASR